LTRLGLLAALSSTAPHTWAADESATAIEPAAEPGVRVHLMGELGRDTKLEQLLSEWLGANDIRHEVVHQVELRLEDIKAPRGSGPAVRIWVIEIGPRRARLYFAEPDAQRYLVRDVPLASGFDEVGREQIVQVVLASTLAFMDRAADTSLAELEQAMPARAPAAAAAEPDVSSSAAPPAPALKTTAPTSSRDRGGTDLESGDEWMTGVGSSVLYGATDKGDEGVAHGPGVSAEVGYGDAVFGLAVRVHGQYRFDRHVTSDRVRLSIREGVTAGSVAVRVQPSGSLCWRAEAGAGAQLLRIEPHARTEDVRARQAVHDERPFAFVAVGPAWRAHGGWIRLMARLDVQLTRTRYDVQSETGARSELAVKRVQPGMFVEVGGELIRF